VERLPSYSTRALIYGSEASGLIDRELATKGLTRQLKLALPHVVP